MITQRTRIQNAIIALIQAGEFYKVTYDEETLLADDVDDTTQIAPEYVTANEIQATFEGDTQHTLSKKRTRATWSFQAIVRFNCQVTLELFEKALIDDPPVLAVDEANNLPQATINLTITRPIHPVNSESSAGTEVRLSFDVDQGRL